MFKVPVCVDRALCSSPSPPSLPLSLPRSLPPSLPLLFPVCPSSISVVFLALVGGGLKPRCHNPFITLNISPQALSLALSLFPPLFLSLSLSFPHSFSRSLFFLAPKRSSVGPHLSHFFNNWHMPTHSPHDLQSLSLSFSFSHSLALSFFNISLSFIPPFLFPFVSSLFICVN